MGLLKMMKRARGVNEQVSNEENSYQEIRETHETEFVLEGSLVIDFNIE